MATCTAVVSAGLTAEGASPGVVAFPPGRVARTNATAATPIAAATTSAPTLRLRAVLRCLRSCWFHESWSGSICFVVISNTSLSSAMRTSCPRSQDGTPLCSERAHGRRADAQDACGLAGVIAVQVEQDEGGALARRQVEQHASDGVRRALASETR